MSRFVRQRFQYVYLQKETMGRIGMLGLSGSIQLGWLRNTTPQSVVASKVDLVGFLQCKQFVVKFALQCRCLISFKYFVGLFVVNKRVHFVVVVCLVHNNRHQSLVCGQYDYVLVCFQSFKCFLFVKSQVTVR